MNDKKNLAKNIVWDLSDFYKNINDPLLKKDKTIIKKRVALFNRKYKEKIDSNVSTKTLLTALQEKEQLSEFIVNFGSYSALLHSKEQNNHKVGLLHSKTSEFLNSINTDLQWFTIQIKNIPIGRLKEIASSSEFSKYKTYLQNLITAIPHTLSEKEEVLNTKKNLTGAEAFVNLYDKITVNERFELTIKKRKQSLTLPEISVIASTHKTRNTRRNARIAISKQFENQKIYYTFILNNLLLNKKVSDEIRNYKYPQKATFKGYQVDKPVVGSMVKAVQDSYDISERFYLAKKRTLGLKKLYEWDRYSKIYNSNNKKITWAEAKNIVLEALLEASKEFHDIAKMFFDNKWIDAELSEGKRHGGYCSYITPSKHPYIFMNFKGEVQDVMTLAHELGHGIHAYLSRNNNFYNFWPSTAIAEIASVFTESLVFDYLYKNLSSKKQKTDMLADKIQSSLATVFRQTAFYLFESDVHNHRRKKGELSTEDFNNYYQSRLQTTFGKGLTLTKYHKNNWMPILHFYHYNFYVFTYAFGELLTNSLYQKYKQNSDEFMKGYIEALRKGGSLRPAEILKPIGINIKDGNTWKQGLKLLDNWVDEFEQVIN